MLIFEDDVLFRDGWTEMLTQALAEMRQDGLDDWILALYSAYDHEEVPLRRGRFYSSYVASSFYGTQGVLYTQGEAVAVSDILGTCGVERFEEPYDLLVKRRAVAMQNLFTTRNSLIQHVGVKTTGLGHMHSSPSFDREWPGSLPG